MQVAKVTNNVVSISTEGLKKKENEDSLGIMTEDNSGILRFCIADGHWGDGASSLVCNLLLDTNRSFPETREAAVSEMQAIESRLFTEFGSSTMNPDTDFTPETSVLWGELNSQTKEITLVSYGDCRMLASRNAQVFFKLETKPTWLGAFSHLGIRNRLSVSTGVVFNKLMVQKNDLLFIYTDGVDECIYMKPTIHMDNFIASLQTSEPEHIAEQLMSKVFEHGAEDNASLIIIKA